jgi:hypothetical protein
VADGTEYELSMAHDTRRSKLLPQTYGYVLHPYRIVKSHNRSRQTVRHVSLAHVAYCNAHP